MNVVGWYPLVRLCFNNSIFAVPGGNGTPAIAYAVCENGAVSSIVVQNGGSGYLAPPQISIVGDGSGATAEAILGGNGSIESITVTNGGSGYWLVPNAGVTNSEYPVPPNNQGALVLIGTGFVENLYYR